MLPSFIYRQKMANLAACRLETYILRYCDCLLSLKSYLTNKSRFNIEFYLKATWARTAGA